MTFDNVDQRKERRGARGARGGRPGHPRAVLTPESQAIMRQLIMARQDADLTQAELSRIIGSDPNHISRMENGWHEPKLAFVAKYAKAVGLNWIEVAP